jgi:hypothetical protein
MKFERIKFERTGGFAGIHLTAEIESDDLSEDQRNEVSELLDEADFEDLPEQLAGRMPIPDEFVYAITVEYKQEEYKVLAGESALPADMRPLLEILERIAKKQMRRKKD